MLPVSKNALVQHHGIVSCVLWIRAIISSRKLGNLGAVKSCLVSIGIRVKFPVKSLITQPIHSCVSQDNMCE